MASEIPLDAAVYHVHRPDGSHHTYLDLVIGSAFPGKLPDDIESISVTGPKGKLAIGIEDFSYSPQWRSFWIVRRGAPSRGRYSFDLTGRDGTGHAIDVQHSVQTIPVPDTTRMRPMKGEINACPTTIFSWPLADHDGPLYYQLQIRDSARQHVYRSDYVLDADEFRLPPNVLEAGADYQWRVRVADGPDWISLNNRSHSKWLPFTKPAGFERCVYPYRVPLETDDGWETASLDDVGINIAAIEALRRSLGNGDYPDIHSLLIVKDGKLVLEEYFGGYARKHPHHLMSVTKSVTSLLIGLALDNNSIHGTDARMVDFFPDYPDAVGDRHLQKIRLHHVLSMTAGLEWNTWIYRDGDPRDSTYAMTRSDDWIGHVLTREAIYPPGEKYVYNNGLSILLGEILRNASGLYADRFAEQHLFAPLGITDYRWNRLDNGTIETAGGLYLRPRDMAKIGQMMLNHGSWQGKQIVPVDWVRQSTLPWVDEKILLGSGYGYQWWRGRSGSGERVIDLFFAAGRGGQYIFVCPGLNLVAVFTSKTFNDSMGEFRPQVIMAQSIIPAMLPAPPPRKIVPIDAEIIEQAVGDYLSPLTLTRATIFNRAEGLFLRSEDGKVDPIYALGDNRFFGTSEQIGNFEAELTRDPETGKDHFIVKIGFGYWRFDKIEN